jgi:hypothetical protein
MIIQDLMIRSFKGLEEVEVRGCGPINALIGKNNSGKSSVLHAIDMAGLALSVLTWDAFQPKLQVKDLFAEAGRFKIELTLSNSGKLELSAGPDFGPVFRPDPNEGDRFKSILVLPDPGNGAKGGLNFPQNGRFKNGSSSPAFSSKHSLKSFLPSSLF